MNPTVRDTGPANTKKKRFYQSKLEVLTTFFVNLVF